VVSAYIVIYLRLKFYSLNLQSNSNSQLCENPVESITKTLSRPYFNKILKDLLKSNPDNARTIVEYILTEQTEINIKELKTL
jgi:hypothetical protein